MILPRTMKRFIPIAITILFSRLVWGAEVSQLPHQVTMSVDADLIQFVKLAIWIGGGFLAIYALIGVAFFGFDVRKAQSSINDAQKEAKVLLKELREDYAALKDLKERLEELGAKLEEVNEIPRNLEKTDKKLEGKPQESVETLTPTTSPLYMEVRDQTKSNLSNIYEKASTRSDIDLIRDVIASSNYEWTTIGRIMKKTGLSRDEILQESRSAADIVISYGRQTKDHIFKFIPNKTILKPALRNIQPLPESREAIEQGCICTTAKGPGGTPLLDRNGEQLYVIEKGCPIHG